MTDLKTTFKVTHVILSISVSFIQTQLVPGEKLRVYEKFYYDAIGQNVRVVAYGKEDNKTIFADVLLLFREVQYHSSCIEDITLYNNASFVFVL